jgi:hypothetical protein
LAGINFTVNLLHAELSRVAQLPHYAPALILQIDLPVQELAKNPLYLPQLTHLLSLANLRKVAMIVSQGKVHVVGLEVPACQVSLEITVLLLGSGTGLIAQ